MLSQSEENYLKAIYSLQLEKETKISTSLIAAKINTKASSVSDMLKRLSEKGLLHYEKYQGVSLSNEGKQIALNIVRNHRIWECFLVNNLNYSWSEVHEIAEQLEHIKSDTLINRLEAYLDFPKLDPHGDPIPDKDGNIRKEHYRMLSTVKEGEEALLIRVKDSSPSFLAYLDKNDITLNSSIKVMAKESFDNSMRIAINDKQITISHQIASNLWVQNIH